MQRYAKVTQRKIEEQEAYSRSGKSKTTAILLGLFLPVGVARIYLGHFIFGIIQVVLGLVGAVIMIDNPMIDGREYLGVLGLLGLIALIVGIVDLVRIIRGTLLPLSDSSLLQSANQAQASHYSPAPTTGTDNIQLLEKLADLKAKGIISEEEFRQKKASILEMI